MPAKEAVKRRLRPISIDGSNIAMSHGRKSNTFSSVGISLAVNEFVERGHKDVVFVPQFRLHINPRRAVKTTNPEILQSLEARGTLTFTPCHEIDGKFVNSYDDRFVIEYASKNGGVIVSNDKYRDIMKESPAFKEAIQMRRLGFCFANGKFMLPSDPLGRDGPDIDEFLAFPT